MQIHHPIRLGILIGIAVVVAGIAGTSPFWLVGLSQLSGGLFGKSEAVRTAEGRTDSALSDLRSSLQSATDTAGQLRGANSDALKYLTGGAKSQRIGTDDVEAVHDWRYYAGRSQFSVPAVPRIDGAYPPVSFWAYIVNDAFVLFIGFIAGWFIRDLKNWMKPKQLIQSAQNDQPAITPFHGVEYK